VVAVGLVIHYYFHERGLYPTVVPVSKPVFKVVNPARPPRARW
jgi:hypothetical protein